MNKLLISMVAASVLGSAASAQSLPSFTHTGTSVTLAYNFHNDDNDEPYDENFTTQLTLRSTFALGGNWSTTFLLGYNEETYEDTFFASRLFVGIEPEYDFGNLDVGAYFITGQHNDIGDDDESESMYGLKASYEAGPWMMEAYFGQYDHDGFTPTTLGLAGGYGFSNGLSLYGFHRRDSDSGDYFALSGIGASFDLANAFGGVPIEVTAEMSRFHDEGTSLSDSDWRQFSLMATYRFGAPKKSVFRGIYNVDYYYD
jgi:predicted porin